MKQKKYDREGDVPLKENAEAPEPDARLPEDAMLCLGFPSNRLYLLTQTERCFVFTCIGSELGVKEGLIPERIPTDRDRSAKHGKDLWLEKAEIIDFQLRMRHSVSTALPNNAVVKLTVREGKRYTMILCEEREKRSYLEFFAQVAGRRSGERNERREERQRRREDRTLAQRRREEAFAREYRGKRTETGSVWAAVACVGLMISNIILFFTAVVSPEPAPIIWIGFMLLGLAWYLVWKYPAYFSLRDGKDKLLTKVESRKNGMILQIFFPAASMFIASIQRLHYDDVPRLVVISGAFVGLLIWLFCVLVRKHLLKRSELISMALLLVMFGSGVPMGLNLLLSTEEPTLTQTRIVAEKFVSKGKYTDSYRLTLEDGRDFDVTYAYFQSVEEGDPVRIGAWDGGLWIPYSQVLEP